MSNTIKGIGCLAMALMAAFGAVETARMGWYHVASISGLVAIKWICESAVYSLLEAIRTEESQ